MNAYTMLKDVRSNLGEKTPAHWADADILRKINAEQRKWATIIASHPGDWLVVSEDITPVASQVTIPSECAKPIYMEEKASGTPIVIHTNIRDRRLTRLPVNTLGDGGILEAYPIKDYIEINKVDYTTEVTLWYQKRIPDLVCGEATTGTTTNTIIIPNEMEPSYEDDYYNDIMLEVVAGTGVGTRAAISDYVASTRTLTIAGTFDDSDTVFGTISELPKECFDILPLGATVILMAKPSGAIDPKYFSYYQQEYKRAKKDLENWLSTRTSGSNQTRIVEYH